MRLLTAIIGDGGQRIKDSGRIFSWRVVEGLYLGNGNVNKQLIGSLSLIILFRQPQEL